MHSVALVGMDGSIDWLCFPHFDSPSIFAAILDDEKGGRFKISPSPNGVTCKQMYWPDTNVLVTRTQDPASAGLRDIPDVLMLAGGLPVEAGDEPVAGVGVAGAPGGDLDEACAQAGIDAITGDTAVTRGLGEVAR